MFFRTSRACQTVSYSDQLLLTVTLGNSVHVDTMDGMEEGAKTVKELGTLGT